MITFFHNFANTWGAKFIFVLLTLCMIVWFGLGSFTNLNPLSEKAVTVGSYSTTIQDVMKDFEAQRKKMSQMTGGQYFSPEKALSSGLLLQVVGQQVSDLVALGIRDQVGLTASNAAVQKYVERNPIFADTLGNFDKNMFYAYLSQNQLTEAALGEKLANELALRHLTDTIERLGYAPDVLSKLIYRRQNEKRNVSALLVSADKITVSEKPSESVLKEYYESESDNLMAPENRSLDVLLVTPEKLSGSIEISNEEIDAVYAEEKSKYVTPEKRHVLQMRFDSAEAADAMKAKVTPDSFAQLASKELSQTEEQTNFGEVTRDGLIEELGEAVFSARNNEIVGPVQSPLGYHIFYVKSIIPETTLPMEEIRADIKKQLASEKAYDVLNDVIRRLEDNLGAGNTLKKAAEQEGLTVVGIPNVDITGQTPSGESIPDDLKNNDLLQNVFILQKGESSAMIEQGSGFIVAEVTGITPVSQKTFEAVKDQMYDLWKTDQQKEKLKEVVQTALDVTSQGNSLEVQGIFSPFEKISAIDVTRTDTKGFPIQALDVLMKQKAGSKHVQSFDLDDKNVLVFVTEKITSADPDQDEAGLKEVSETLKKQSGESLSQQTIAAFAKQFGVTINEQEINKAFSVYKTQN